MKKAILGLFLALAVLAVPRASFAQTQPALNTFSIQTTALALPGNNSTVAASLDGVTLGLTQNFELRQTNLIAPGSVTGFYGGFNYNVAPFSKWLNNLSPQLNGYDFRAELTANLGVDRITASSVTTQHWSAIVGGTIKYAVKGSKTYNLVCEVDAVRLPGYVAGWKPAVSLGTLLTFGSKARSVSAHLVPTF